MATNNVFSSFQATYKFRIAGTYNAGYANVARAVSNEDTAARLKSRLTANTIQINQIRNSGADADTISKQAGQTQLTYLRTASQALYDVRNSSNKLRDFRASLSSLSKDLESAVNEYLTSTTRTTAEDAKFKDNADYILRKLAGMLTTIKGRSASEGTRFDINLYQTDRRLDKLRTVLNTFPAAGVAAPTSAGLDDGSISGTTASKGTTLDISA